MIRPAVESDLPELLRMGEAFLSRTAFAHVPFDPDSAARLIVGLIDGGGLLLVAERETGLCGMLAMVTFPHYFNMSVKAAQEFFWWVDPDARGKGVAAALLERAERWAGEQGCASVHMLSLDSLDGASVARMYERRGYVPLERTFVRFL